jgi:hypothetical protein
MIESSSIEIVENAKCPQFGRINHAQFIILLSSLLDWLVKRIFQLMDYDSPQLSIDIG